MKDLATETQRHREKQNKKQMFSVVFLCALWVSVAKEAWRKAATETQRKTKARKIENNVGISV